MTDRLAVARLLCWLSVAVLVTACGETPSDPSANPAPTVRAESGAVELDGSLAAALRQAGFTGRVEATLESRLGRRIDREMADLGRLLFFDKVLGLHNDNSCAGCHAPANGFGDSQVMAIGVDNNDVVGPSRRGPRNQRRSPSVINTVFYPALMWTARFSALSGDPFRSPQGFKFPAPENIVLGEPTLLAAQGSLPSTELVEMAGFNGITANPGPFGPRHLQFDNGVGQLLPAPDATGFHNFPIQDAVNARLNRIVEYQRRFGRVFNGGRALPPGGITMSMRRRALAEFQIAHTAANAPIDRFARGQRGAMTAAQKRGALLFFGRANCVSCHQVGGASNEMFSDFANHRIGGPQVVPGFGVGRGNVIFDGPGENEDFGFEQTSGDPSARYTFRTAPLRNLKVAAGFFHNGAFGTLEAAIAHHLDPVGSLEQYDPRANRLPPDLTEAPYQGILAAGLDPLLRQSGPLTPSEFTDLVTFVRDGLFDERVARLCPVIPRQVPSGMALQRFEGCR